MENYPETNEEWYSKFLLHENFDFIFILTDDENKEVPANRLKVSAASKELEIMLHYLSLGNEYTPAPVDQMEVAGISIDAFIIILRYIHDTTANIYKSINKDNVFTLITKSHYFGIRGVENECCDFLHFQLDDKTRDVLLVYSCFLSISIDAAMLNKCESLIQEHGLLAMKSDDFLQISLAVLGKVLSFDVIMCSEFDLFERTLAWAANECVNQNIPVNTANKRKVLNGVENLLRFTTLTLNEFHECLTVDLDFYSAEEIAAIENTINSGTSTQVRRRFKNKEDTLWVKRSSNDDNIVPPHAMCCFSGPHTMCFGRIWLNGKYELIEIIPALNKICFPDNYQGNNKDYEVLCSWEKICVEFPDFETWTVNFDLHRNSGIDVMGITVDGGGSPKNIHYRFVEVTNNQLWNFYSFNELTLSDPNLGVPENVIVGGYIDGEEYLMCRVHHEGNVLPARVKRGGSVATVAFNGTCYVKNEFLYLSYDNTAFIPYTTAFGQHAPVGGLAKCTEFDCKDVYIGRVNYNDQLIPGMVVENCLYISYKGEEIQIVRDFEMCILLENY